MGIVKCLEDVGVASAIAFEEFADGVYCLLRASCLVVDDSSDAVFSVDTVYCAAQEYGQGGAVAIDGQWVVHLLLAFEIGEGGAVCIDGKELAEVFAEHAVYDELCTVVGEGLALRSMEEIFSEGLVNKVCDCFLIVA